MGGWENAKRSVKLPRGQLIAPCESLNIAGWTTDQCDPGTRVGPEKYEPLSIMELSTSTELFSIDIIVSILSIDNWSIDGRIVAADIDPTGSSILRYFTDSYGDIVACYNSCIMQHYVIIFFTMLGVLQSTVLVWVFYMDTRYVPYILSLHNIVLTIL